MLMNILYCPFLIPIFHFPSGIWSRFISAKGKKQLGNALNIATNFLRMNGELFGKPTILNICVSLVRQLVDPVR